MKKTFFYFLSIFTLLAFLCVSCEPKGNPIDGEGSGNPKDSIENPTQDSIDNSINDSIQEPDVQDPEGGGGVTLPEEFIQMQALTSEYSTGAEMGYSEAVSHSFLLKFASPECEVVMGEAFGNGDVLVLELCSSTAENMLPATGVYQIGDYIKDGCIVAGFEYNSVTPIGTYVYKMEDDMMVGFDCIIDGVVEIKKTDKEGELEFLMYAIFENGEEAFYYYKGELVVEHIWAEK